MRNSNSAPARQVPAPRSCTPDRGSRSFEALSRGLSDDVRDAADLSRTCLPTGRRQAGAAGVKTLLRRTAVAVAGGVLIVVGLLLVPLPGPGWAIVFSGVAVLGVEFPWAERLSHRARALFARGVGRLRSAGLLVCVAIGVVILASLVVPFLLVLA